MQQLVEPDDIASGRGRQQLTFEGHDVVGR